MMRIGKLDNDVLERLVLNKFSKTRPESFGAPAIGADCARLDFGGDYTILSCDPITSASVRQLGRLTVHVNCNDAAAAGADPVGLLVTLLMPPDGTHEQIGLIADDIAEASRAAHVDILGGHTEVTDAVTRPVACAFVAARLARSTTLCGMRCGDDVVLTKSAAVEGTAILAEDFAARLGALSADVLAIAKNFSSLLSVVPESRIAMQNGAHAMHDVTEGGVLGALWELAYANGCAVDVDLASIRVRTETKQICDALGLDPLRLIGSGSLLIACEDGAAMVRALSKAHIDAAVVARAVAGETSTIDGQILNEPHADELYRVELCSAEGKHSKRE